MMKRIDNKKIKLELKKNLLQHYYSKFFEFCDIKSINNLIGVTKEIRKLLK